jgi:hypothetical protein
MTLWEFRFNLKQRIRVGIELAYQRHCERSEAIHSLFGCF